MGNGVKFFGLLKSTNELAKNIVLSDDEKGNDFTSTPHVLIGSRGGNHDAAIRVEKGNSVATNSNVSAGSSPKLEKVTGITLTLPKPWEETRMAIKMRAKPIHPQF